MALSGPITTLDTLAVATTLLLVADGAVLAYLLNRQSGRPSSPTPAPQATSAAAAAEAAAEAAVVSLKKPRPYLRPLASSQRHDSSSTLPPPSAPSLTASSAASTVCSSRGRRSSLADTASLAGFSVSNRTASIPANKQQVEEQDDDDVSPVAPDQGEARPETPPAAQSGVTVAPAAAEQLFVSLPAAASMPLQAMSAPLTGLALSTSSSQVVSMQSLSDPTVSVIQTPSKAPASQAQLPASVALQGPAAAAGSSKAPARTGTAADAAGPAPSDGACQQHDSEAAPTLDLAAVLAPGPRAAPGQMPAAPAGVVGSSSTPAAPTARVAPPTPPGVRPIGTCLPAAPWSPGHLGAAAEQGAAGTATSNLLYGAAPARPLPTNSLYKSPLGHVTLSVKVCIAIAKGCSTHNSQCSLPASANQTARHQRCLFLLVSCCLSVTHRCHTSSRPQQPPACSPWWRATCGLVSPSWQAPTASHATPSTQSCTWSASQAAFSCPHCGAVAA